MRILTALLDRLAPRRRYVPRHLTDGTDRGRSYVELVAAAARRAEADWRASHVLAVTGPQPVVDGTAYGRRRRQAVPVCTRSVIALPPAPAAMPWARVWAAAAIGGAA